MSSEEDPLGEEPERSLEGERDHLCDQFEKAWRRGEQPRIEAYLAQVPEEQQAELLRELLLVEWELRPNREVAIQLPDYLTRFEPFSDVVRQVIAADDTDDRRAGEDDTVDHPPPRRMRKACCPHCSERVEIHILDEQAQVNITCPTCQNGFGLIRGTRGTNTHVGDLYGRYQLLKKVGEGSFGEVWKAQDTELDRFVAVKIPTGRHSEFGREARAAAQLDHPNIVRVYDVKTEQWPVYIVSDFITGLSLADWLKSWPKDQRPSFREVAVICQKIALALHHAHEAGVIHRDMKPSNVMLDEAGEPYVMDFGLAKREAGDVSIATEGTILGSPAYMPPEQARGESSQVDRRSDVYSLGVTLFELLTKELPFPGTDPQMVLKQVLEDEPPSPAKFVAGIPKVLETLTLRCMEKERHGRPPDALFVADELDSFLNDTPGRLHPVSRTERAWKWCKRNPVVAGLSAAVVLVLCSGILASSAFAVRAQNEATRANEQTAAKTVALTKLAQALEGEKLERLRAEKQESIALSQLYAAQIAAALGEWQNNRALSAWNHLRSTRVDLRGWEYDYLHTLFNKNQTTLSGHSEPVRSVIFSPDGKQILSCSSAEIEIWDSHSGKITRTISGVDRLVTSTATLTSSSSLPTVAGTVSVYFISAAFSPNAKQIASGNLDGTIKIWDAITGEEVRTLREHLDSVSSVAFSPDGKWIVSGSGDKTIKIWDAITGEEVRTLREHLDSVNSVAFSPDGKWIVSGSGDKTIKIWDAITGEEVRTLLGHLDWVNCVAFSPDGEWIVSGSGDKTIKIWDAITGEEVRTLREHLDSVSSVAFSPDGEWIVSGSGDKTIKIWDAITGEEYRTLLGHLHIVDSVGFSPNGEEIVSGSWDRTIKIWSRQNEKSVGIVRAGDGRTVSLVTYSPDGSQIAGICPDNLIKIWDAHTGIETRTLRGHDDFVRSITFSPDGKQIASASMDDTIKIWNALTGKEVRTLRGHLSMVNSVAFSRDGNWIVSGSGDKTIKIWVTQTGENIQTLKGHLDSVWSVGFSPNGKQVFSGSEDKTIKMWDAQSGKEVRTLRGHLGPVYCVAFSPNGKQVFSGSEDKTIKMWDARTGEELASLIGHTQEVHSISISPIGKRIVSLSANYSVTDYEPFSIKIWDVESGQVTFELKGHFDKPIGVSFSPDGNSIISGAMDGTIRVWEAQEQGPDSFRTKDGTPIPKIDPQTIVPQSEVEESPVKPLELP